MRASNLDQSQPRKTTNRLLGHYPTRAAVERRRRHLLPYGRFYRSRDRPRLEALRGAFV